MESLPAGPLPPPRRQLLVGTALGCAAATMLVGAMIAVWMVKRDQAIDTEGTWVPSDVAIPEVASNIILITFGALVLFAQWAVYAGKRGERANTALALGTTGLMAIAIINAQAYAFVQMELPLDGSVYGAMFYAITGVFLTLIVIGLAFTAVAVFRVLAGRADDELVISHALYWYFAATAFAAIWYFVYVTK